MVLPLRDRYHGQKMSQRKVINAKIKFYNLNRNTELFRIPKDYKETVCAPYTLFKLIRRWFLKMRLKFYVLKKVCDVIVTTMIFQN